MRYFLLFLIINLCAVVKGQVILFSEDFETGQLPLEWKNEKVSGAIDWRYEDGGYSDSPLVPNSGRPPAAHGGSYNALFQFQDINGETTKLVTKRINALEFAIKPELRFWHAQYEWKHFTEFYNDELRVYYKNSETGPWVFLKEYTVPTTSWVERIIPLPDSTLSGDYYLAFEGKTNWGFGVCVDDVVIEEKGILNKRLSSLNIVQATDLPVSSGSRPNPILRFDLKVFGNTGTCMLDSLVITSLNTDDSDLSNNGVKLYFTEEPEFNPTTQIGTGANFISGKAVFDNIGFDIPIGYSYLWLTYDVDSAAGHKDILDAKIETNSILINDTLYPAVDISPTGSRYILQTFFFDDFETDKGWTFTGEFQRGRPKGLGGSQGNEDPVSAYSDTTIIGTDMEGLNTYPGDYEVNLADRAYQAVSPPFNFKYYNDLLIRYMRWLNVGINDYVRIDVSTDDGANWQQVWYNPSMILDNQWTLHEVNINSVAGRKENVRIRYTLGPTNDYWQFSGWNIDNFGITGNYITADVGISQILGSIDNGCNHSSTDSITAIVKNYGAIESPDVIPLRFILESSSGSVQTVYDTIRQSIPFNDSIIYTFPTRADMSVPSVYTLYVKTLLPSDEDNLNDQKSKVIYAQSTKTTPYLENFESNRGLWIFKNNGTTSWEYGTPGYGITPPSGSKVWMTQLLQDYINDDSSFIESVCYDLTDNNRFMVELKYWIETEKSKDGAMVQYSIDSGSTWKNIKENEYGWDWEWYDQYVEALDTLGWSGDSMQWITARQLLPAEVASVPYIKFRVEFASDNLNSNKGIALDDFNIYPAPPDIGVLSIDMPETNCLYANPDNVSISVKNYGLNKIRANDTILVGYSLDANPSVYDTIITSEDFNPGDTIEFTFNESLDLSTVKSYIIKAFTLYEDDPWFYGNNNDTTSKTFDVMPLPVTSLVDTIQSREPDTVIIRAYINPDYSYLWEGGLSTADTLKVPGDGVYHLMVTDTGGNGCSISDSVYVELLYNDAGIDSFLSPVTSCELSDSEYLQVFIKNYGTDSIVAGSSIYFWYEINGGTAVEDTLVLYSTFYSKQTIPFTFDNVPADFSSVGLYDIKTYLYFGGDTVRNNDTLYSHIEVYGYPTVDLGQDTALIGVSYLLDAGEGFDTYLWEDGDTIQTHLVENTDTYHVMVVDEHGCPAYDTIYIRLKTRDILPDMMISPVSTCVMTGTAGVQLRVKNNGNDTIPVGAKIYVKYKMNDNAQVSDSITLASMLIPGATATHDFTQQEDMTSSGDYKFMLTATTANDLRPFNDTIFDTVRVYPQPVVDFGLPSLYTTLEPQVVLDAGYNENYTYLWQNPDSTEHTYTASTYNIYKVTATDTRTGCSGQDQVTIVFIFRNIEIDTSNLPSEICAGTLDNIQIAINNNSNGALPSGTTFQVGYKINETVIAEDQVTLTQPLPQMNIVYHTLDSLLEINSVPATVKIYTVMENDKIPEDDTLTMIYSVLKPSPVINFGDANGILKTSFPHVLDAGAGQSTYLWDNGATTQTRITTTPGIYSVTVTGTNSCKAAKSVELQNDISVIEDHSGRPLNISVYPNPATDYFNIEIDARNHQDLTIELYSVSGMLMHSAKVRKGELYRETYDINRYKEGIYYIKVFNKEVNYIGKIVIY